MWNLAVPWWELILLGASAVQPAMTGPDSSLLGGLSIIGSLVAVDGVVGLARARVPIVNQLLEPRPSVLAEDGKWQSQAMEEQDVTLEDGEMALREHGIADIEDVELAVLEADGSISVVPKDQS